MDVEAALVVWLRNARAANFPVTAALTIECSGGQDHLMRCVKQLEYAFLGPSMTAKQMNIREFFSAQ